MSNEKRSCIPRGYLGCIVGCHRAAKARGLCVKCYASARSAVKAGKTTWHELVAKGLALESQRAGSAFTEALVKAAKQTESASTPCDPDGMPADGLSEPGSPTDLAVKKQQKEAQQLEQASTPCDLDGGKEIVQELERQGQALIDDVRQQSQDIVDAGIDMPNSADLVPSGIDYWLKGKDEQAETPNAELTFKGVPLVYDPTLARPYAMQDVKIEPRPTTSGIGAMVPPKTEPPEDFAANAPKSEVCQIPGSGIPLEEKLVRKVTIEKPGQIAEERRPEDAPIGPHSGDLMRHEATGENVFPQPEPPEAEPPLEDLWEKKYGTLQDEIARQAAEPKPEPPEVVFPNTEPGPLSEPIVIKREPSEDFRTAFADAKNGDVVLIPNDLSRVEAAKIVSEQIESPEDDAALGSPRCPDDCVNDCDTCDKSSCGGHVVPEPPEDTVEKVVIEHTFEMPPTSRPQTVFTQSDGLGHDVEPFPAPTEPPEDSELKRTISEFEEAGATVVVLPTEPPEEALTVYPWENLPIKPE